MRYKLALGVTSLAVISILGYNLYTNSFKGTLFVFLLMVLGAILGWFANAIMNGDDMLR